MIMRQEEKIISLISYYALPTASRKYFLDYAVLLLLILNVYRYCSALLQTLQML